MGFACHSLCKKGFSRSGRAYQKSALWQIGSDIRIFFRIVKEIYNLL